MKLHKSIFSIRHALTTKESRYLLGNIRIHNGRAQATDGKFACDVQLGDTDHKAFPVIAGVEPLDPDALMIPKDTADKVWKSLPKKSTLPVLQEAMIGQNGQEFPVIVTTDLDNSQQFKTGDPAQTFPNLDMVMPPKGKIVGRITLDLHILEKIVKVLKDFSGSKPEETPVSIVVYEDKEERGEPSTLPAMMYADNGTGQRIRIAVMPMKSKGSDYDWNSPESTDKS